MQLVLVADHLHIRTYAHTVFLIHKGEHSWHLNQDQNRQQNQQENRISAAVITKPHQGIHHPSSPANLAIPQKVNDGDSR